MFLEAKKVVPRLEVNFAKVQIHKVLVLHCSKKALIKTLLLRAVIAQWIRLRLKCCGLGFEFQEQHSTLFPFIVYCTIFVIVLRKGQN